MLARPVPRQGAVVLASVNDKPVVALTRHHPKNGSWPFGFFRESRIMGA